MDELTALVAGEVAEVLDLGGPVDPDAALAEELGADSLDLVEALERVEAALQAAGHDVVLADEDVRAVRTARDAGTALARLLGGRG